MWPVNLALTSWLESAQGWIVAVVAIITGVGVWLGTVWPRVASWLAHAWGWGMYRWQRDRTLTDLAAAVGSNGGKSLHQRLDEHDGKLDRIGGKLDAHLTDHELWQSEHEQGHASGGE